MKFFISVGLLLFPLTCAVPGEASQAYFKAPNAYPISPVLLEAITNQQKTVEQEAQPGMELKTDVANFDTQMASFGSGDLGRLSVATDHGDLDDLDSPSSLHCLRFLLASTFEKGVIGSGKVWAIPPSSPEDSTVILAGLGLNPGLCYDSEHDFLYVFDSTLEDKGRIFQYKAESGGKKMRIEKPEYTVIYEGERVTACSVDGYSNLYFTHGSAVNFVSYLDLWTGFKNQFEVLYSGMEDKVEGVVDFFASGYLTLYWVNSEGDGDLAVMAPGRYRFGRPPDTVTDSVREISFAADEDYIYKGFADGSIVSTERATGNSVLKATIAQPSLMCVGDSSLYVADTKNDVIFTLAAESAIGVPVKLAGLANISDLQCVLAPSAAVALALTWLSLA